MLLRALASWTFLAPTTIGALAAEAPVREIRNLEAFARLYGYVRFFHPSDEAASIDWNRFALHGVAVVRGAGDREELAVRLRSLFGPIAPTVQLFAEGAAPPSPAAPPPEQPEGALELVAWQHRGVGLGPGTLYASARTHRAREVRESGRGFGTITQGIDAAPHRGATVKLTAAVRAEVEPSSGRGHLWLRVDRPRRQIGFFDNMGDRPIVSTEWRTYEIEGPVADDADRIFFGGFLAGEGTVWIDALELQVRREGAEWRRIEVANGDFERSAVQASGWSTPSPGYVYAIDSAVAWAGERSVRIRHSVETVEERLFATAPRAGETVDKDLGEGLRARIPLALYSDSKGTLGGDPDSEALDTLRSRLAAIVPDALDGTHRDLRDAAVVIAWNVFQHFYPYFDVIDTDWGEVLAATFFDVAADGSTDELVDSLRRMVAELDDGHGRVITREDLAPAAFRAEWVEGQVIVVESFADAIRPGDLVLAVDGVPTPDLVRAAEALISGSPQWKRYRAVQEIGLGAKGTTVRLRVDRGGQAIDVELERDHRFWQAPAAGPAIEELADGIFYVDLRRAEIGEIEERIQELAAAPGIVFDLRGYPNGNHAVITHLVDEPVRSAIWNVPEIIYPDRQEPIGWHRPERWLLEPAEPRFAGDVAFLTHAGAISYAESVLGIVEHYRLGEIVGQPTAGANGNTNPFTLPGGLAVSWTGMKVLKHDGSQHHLVGIRPTVPAQRTIAGVRAGRDEVLGAALARLAASSALRDSRSAARSSP